MAPAAKRICLVTMAITKMVAFVIAAGTVGYFIDQWDRKDETSVSLIDYGVFGRQEFFFFSLGIGFFVAILSMAIAIANLQDKVHWALTMFILHAFCALALLVSGSLLGKTSTTFEKKKVCKDIETHTENARCYQLIIGVVFGFVSMVLCVGDTIIYISTLTQNLGISFVNMENIPA